MTTDGNDGDGDGDHALHLPLSPKSHISSAHVRITVRALAHVACLGRAEVVPCLAFGNTSPSSHACEINYMQSSQLRDGKVKPWMAGRSLARYAP